MKKFYKVILNRAFFVLFFLLLLVVVASGNHKTNNFVNNINGVRSIEAIHIVSKYDNRNNQLEVIPVSNMSEAVQYGPTNPISFVGEMTAYQANCVGCSGKVGCPPRQDVRNNNIYFEDVTYGTVRILAADMAIPCGSIVRVSNVSFSTEPIIGIVLDRGGAIKGNIMDFLVAETDDPNVVGRQKNVQYEILRWGW